MKDLRIIVLMVSLLSLISCGANKSSGITSGSTSKKASATVSSDTLNSFIAEVKKASPSLENFEIGMKRLITVGGYFKVESTDCPYIIKSEEEIVGINFDGSPDIQRLTFFGNVSGDFQCINSNFYFKLEVPNVNAFLADLRENLPSRIDKIGNSKFRLIRDHGESYDLVLDLNKSMFFNPVESASRNEDGVEKFVVVELP